ncbi:MAG: polysaccharide deacetylase family protein [Patescibacteria group bacterium]
MPTALIIFIIIILIIGLTYYFTIWFKPSLFGYFPDSIKTEQKIIALSFDDGPNPPYTDRLLEILQQHNVHATFFMPAYNIEKFPDLARRILNEGHVIGNHSYAHKFSNNYKTLTFEKEITRAQKIIRDVTGKSSALYRPPWLFKQPFLLKNLRAHGLTPVSGFFGSNWEIWHAPAERIASDALKVVKPGRILIFHDGFDTKGGARAGSVEAINLIVLELKKQGYEFLTVDELLGIKAYQD